MTSAPPYLGQCLSGLERKPPHSRCGRIEENMISGFDKIEKALTREELAVLGLRALYQDYGYRLYRMSKFEEYDLYAKNKDFLVSESVITFTDTDGRLLALKPDVTLSIIKNSRDVGQGVSKLCYDENIYRVSKGTNSFKEITQSGIECFGSIGEAELTEVVSLAARSIDLLCEGGCIALSHLDIVSGVLDGIGISQEGRAQIILALGQKNLSLAISALTVEGIADGGREAVEALFSTYGWAEDVLPLLDKFKVSERTSQATEELCGVVRGVMTVYPEAKLRIDFSLLGNSRYYNGITFSGFIPTAPVAVLAGGQYDNLMARMKRSDRAVGFAVYLDEIK